MKNNIVGWFEIPVSNMERAITFYETVLGLKLDRNQMGPFDMAWFPWIEGAYGSGGSLVYYPEAYKPSADGVVHTVPGVTGSARKNRPRRRRAMGLGKCCLASTPRRPPRWNPTKRKKRRPTLIGTGRNGDWDQRSPPSFQQSPADASGLFGPHRCRPETGALT